MEKEHFILLIKLLMNIVCTINSVDDLFTKIDEMAEDARQHPLPSFILADLKR